VPCCHHITRTLLIDAQGFLLVQAGSGSNVDQNDLHARIHKFDVDNLPASGYNWNSGQLVVTGLRNEVGFNFDSQDRLWGVENGVDDLNRDDLGGSQLYQNNPCEEVNLLWPNNSTFFGYPFCWSEWEISTQHGGKGKGTQWAHPLFIHDGLHNDAWCKDKQNVVPPAYCLPAHTAPLDIVFYNGNGFPSDYRGNAFVSLHGSWDRSVSIGFAVVRIRFEDGNPVSHEVFLRSKQSPGKTSTEDQQLEGQWGHRPVGLGVGRCADGVECLFVSDDRSGVILAVGYVGGGI